MKLNDAKNRYDVIIDKEKAAQNMGIHEDVLSEYDYIDGVLIHKKATLGNNVRIGLGSLVEKGAHIGNNVVIGENSSIGPSVHIYDDTQIGDSVHIEEGALIDQSSHIGDYVDIGKVSVVRSNVVIDDSVSIGDDVNIFEYVKINSFVTIGNFVDIGSNTHIQSDIHIESYVNINHAQNIIRSPVYLYFLGAWISEFAQGMISVTHIPFTFKEFYQICDDGSKDELAFINTLKDDELTLLVNIIKGIEKLQQISPLSYIDKKE